MLGIDLFRGDKIKGQGISEFDDFLSDLNLLKRLIPNFPFVPGHIQLERIRKAREDESPLKEDEMRMLAFLNTLGLKIEKTDLSRLRSIKGLEFRKKKRCTRSNASYLYSV